MDHEIIRLWIDSNLNVTLLMSPLLVGAAIFVFGLAFFTKIRKRRWEFVKVDVQLGGVGKVELRPKEKDIQIAYRIWIELVTRKAALPIDPELDVIVEV